MSRSLAKGWGAPCFLRLFPRSTLLVNTDSQGRGQDYFGNYPLTIWIIQSRECSIYCSSKVPHNCQGDSELMHSYRVDHWQLDCSCSLRFIISWARIYCLPDYFELNHRRYLAYCLDRRGRFRHFRCTICFDFDKVYYDCCNFELQ